MTRKSGACTICGKTFRRSNHVKAHLLTHTNKMPLKCFDCGSFHRTKGNLNKHSRYVHGGEKRSLEIECILCKKTMTRSNLNRHLRMHLREKPYSCSICALDFLDSGNFNRHVKSHENVKGDPCVFCGKTFSIFSKPQAHIRSHIKEKPYCCKRCPSSFSRKGNLGVHIRAVHLKERRYSCELCKNTYCSRAVRDKHMSVHLNEKPFQCKICFKRYKSSWGFKCHLVSHNGMKKQKFPCRKWGKIFSYKSNLLSHEKTKHQLNQCIVCEKKVTSDFMAHLLKHTNERPFPCMHNCEKDFQTLDNLKSHVLFIHSTERPYPCEICEKSFKTKACRRKHIKSHLNERPFPCTLCPKKLATSKGLKIHLKLHVQK